MLMVVPAIWALRKGSSANSEEVGEDSVWAFMVQVREEYPGRDTHQKELWGSRPGEKNPGVGAISVEGGVESYKWDEIT